MYIIYAVKRRGILIMKINILGKLGKNKKNGENAKSEPASAPIYTEPTPEPAPAPTPKHEKPTYKELIDMLMNAAPASAPIYTEPTPEPAPAPAPMYATPTPEPTPIHDEPGFAPELELSKEAINQLIQERFDAYGILGLDKNATAQEIDKAYSTMMNKLLYTDVPPAELKDTVGAVDNAYQILRMYRNSYDKAYDKIISQNEPEFIDPPDLDETPDLNAIREEFLDLNGDLIDAYEILNVGKDATNKDILDAYEKAKKGIKTKKTKELARKACDILLNNKAEYDEILSKVQPSAPASDDDNNKDLTDAEKEYRELEAKTKEAFKKAQEAKTAAEISKYKEKAAELAKKKKEAEEEAKKAAKERRKQKELQNDAKDKAKEARKQLRKAKNEEKKNKRAEKKAEKAIETVNKKKDKRRVLIKKPMSGKLKKGIAYGVAGALLIGAGATGGMLYANHKNNKKLVDDQRPAYEDQMKDVPSPTPEIYPEETVNVTPTPQASASETPETTTPQETVNETQAPVATEEVVPDMTEITEDAKIIYENWTTLGSAYTEDNIVELIKCLRGYESSITIDSAVDMIEEIILQAIVPAVDNLQIGENIQTTHQVNLVDLVADNDEAKPAIKDIQDCINNILADIRNREVSINEGLAKIIAVIKKYETVDGFNPNTSSPAARIVWAEAATALTGLASIQNEDEIIVIDGVAYYISGLADTTTYTEIINSAKADLGSVSKVPVL